MTPVIVTAALESAAINPDVALDGLLAASIAQRLDLPPIGAQDERGRAEAQALLIKHVAGVVALSPCQRFFLVSDAQIERVQNEKRWLNRRFSASRAVELGGAKVRRVELTTGLSKSYRIPLATVHASKVQWFALADANALRETLEAVTHLGKKRSVGCGRVTSWTVQECKAWDGFPVLRDGAPLRSLPLDHAGLKQFAVEQKCLMFPYWEYRNEQPCAVA